MDCSNIADRVAAYLDNELARSELALFEEHLESCEACQELVERVSAVDLSPPPPPPEVSDPAFWARMDGALAEEQRRIEAEAATAAPAMPPAANRLMGRQLRVSFPVILGYVAFLMLAIGWSLMNLQRAQTAEAALQNMEELVQREQRQNQAPPAEIVPEGSVRVASSTRGTF